MVFMFITAAVMAEICSALPLSGSIYIWAAESAGPKYGRFFGFVVAWWSCTAWMTFAAGNCQTAANYIVSQLAVWEIDFQEALVMTTSNGVSSFGPSLKVSF
ncbi:Thiamine transporter thi9 [Cerrena zonata]|uniref:Thiamine transporter thi9 n=1 Tax=Cerrena zonata TaxID=2478898 RepID=A0AAW0FN63_9APHY